MRVQTKKIRKTDDVTVYADNTFLFCKELNKGFLKKDISGLELEDTSFENVVQTLENLSYDELVAVNLNSLLFENGMIAVSERVEEKLKLELSTIDNEEDRNNHIDLRRMYRRYFKLENLTSPNLNTQTNQLIF